MFCVYVCVFVFGQLWIGIFGLCRLVSLVTLVLSSVNLRFNRVINLGFKVTLRNIILGSWIVAVDWKACLYVWGQVCVCVCLCALVCACRSAFEVQVDSFLYI